MPIIKEHGSWWAIPEESFDKIDITNIIDAVDENPDVEFCEIVINSGQTTVKCVYLSKKAMGGDIS